MRKILFFLIVYSYIISPAQGSENLIYDSIIDYKSYLSTYQYFSRNLFNENVPLYNKHRHLFYQLCTWVNTHPIEKKGNILDTLNIISGRNKDITQRVKIIEQILQFSHKKDKIKTSIYIYEMAFAYSLLERPEDALYYFNKNIENLKNETNDTLKSILWLTYRELGNFYFNLENYEQALKCFKNYNKYEGYRNRYFGPSILNDIGQCYKYLGLKDSAIMYWNMAIDAVSTYKWDEKELAKYQFHIKGLVSANYYDYRIAEKKYKEALAIGREEYKIGLDYDKYAERRGLFKITESYYYLKKWDSVSKFFHLFMNSKAIDKFLKYKLKAYRYKLIADIEMNKKEEIPIDLENISKYEDSISKRATEYSKHFIFRTNYDLTEEELSLANDKLALQSVNDKYKNIILALLVAMTLGVVYFFVKARKKNKQIESQKQIIEQENQKQKILLKEIHHRVKNNLQLISSYLQLQLSRTDVNSDMALQDSIKNIETIALVHENLYKKNNIDEVNVRTYIEALSQNTLNISHHNDISLRLKIDEIYLDIDRAISIGLIINELITNSVKYAFSGKKGEIRIDIIQINSVLKMSYKDDGKGVSVEKLIKNKSIGIRMIESIAAEDLQGSYRYQLDKGFGFEMEFKLNSNQQE